MMSLVLDVTCLRVLSCMAEADSRSELGAGELLRARGQEPQQKSGSAPTTVVAPAMTITARCLHIFVSDGQDEKSSKRECHFA